MDESSEKPTEQISLSARSEPITEDSFLLDAEKAERERARIRLALSPPTEPLPPPIHSGLYWFKFVLKFLAVFLLAGFVVGIIAYVTIINRQTAAHKQLIDFDNLFDPDFQPVLYSVSWPSDDSFALTKHEDNGTYLFLYDAKSGKEKLIIDYSEIRDKYNIDGISSFVFSKDEKLVLFAYNATKVRVKLPRWRNSYDANYFVFDVISQSATILAINGTNARLSAAAWAPSRQSVHGVSSGNIYDFNAENGTVTAITIDGDDRSGTLNGVQSWVYEEEIYSSPLALWSSPQNDYLAFLRSDESQVGVISIPFYPKNVLLDPYPTMKDFPYPKTGTLNPKVRVKVYSYASGNTTEVDIGSDEYVTGVTWLSATRLLVRTLNRGQNIERMHVFDVPSLNSVSRFVSQNSGDFGWALSHTSPPTVINANTICYLRNHSGFVHIALVNTTSGTVSKFLTSGEFDVTDILSYHSPTRTLYFLSAQISPMERHIYSVSISSGSIKALTGNEGYFSASFSTGGSFASVRNLGPGVPTQQVYAFAGPQMNLLYELSNNSALFNRLKSYDLPKREFVTVRASNGDVDLNAFILTPPRSHGDKFGLLLNVYGGPGSQTVTKQWAFGFNEYLASRLGLVVASIASFFIMRTDGSGTGARGLNFLSRCYLQQGVMDALDQVSGAAQLAKRLSSVDSARVGIWGWSYGGTLSLSSLLRDTAGVLRTAISVAPVTDWRLYDTVYTERYMRTPMNNWQGFNATSILVNSASLQRNHGETNFLLIHGTGDDNVHFENSVELNMRLIEHGVQYTTMIYGNRDHSINGGNSRQHLYRLIETFLRRTVSLVE